MERRCIVFIGLQASGKTTFWQQRFPDLIHVNLDTLHTRNKEHLLLKECLEAGTSFVVDNTNPTKADRQRYITAAKEHGYRVIGYYFQSSITACKERNNRRTGKAQVPGSALAATHAKMELPSYDEGFNELYYSRIDGNTFVIEPWSEEN